MTTQPDVIELAQQLLHSLYASSDLSIDQFGGIAAALERARELEKERDQYRQNNTLAAQSFVAAEARLRDAIERTGYLERMLTILRDAARPAAAILFNLAQQPGIDERVRESMQQTLAPLDAALAATKGTDT